ncbi:hypothetical protein QBC38DRAFT_228014 [Podospora fimiseda]|uniref:Uncharacterized protein n=1 Tax=Podospora fimiseda TaxID=252190 RepID=A0AAN7BNC9_9PEZI|nr:hypothetical protein QBC38DRAFT_228014 [Podospora fimiseda]
MDANGQILSISAPVLAHPIAQRISVSLRHFESDSINSAAADVGRTIPNVPASQKNDNDKWRSWLQQTPSATSTHRIAKRKSRGKACQITPGVSELSSPRESSPAPLPSLEDSTPCPKRVTVSKGEIAGQFPSSSDTSIMLALYEDVKRRIHESAHYEEEAHLDDNNYEARVEQEGLGMVERDIIFEESNDSTQEVDFHRHAAFETDRDAMDLTETYEEEDRNNSWTMPEWPPSKGPSPQTHARNLGTWRDRCSMFSNELDSSDKTVAPPDPIKPKQPDAAEAWKTFVFGDEKTDELEAAAFAKATYDAARHYKPFNRSKLMERSEGDKPFKTAGFRSPTEVSASVDLRPSIESPDTPAPLSSIDANIPSTEDSFDDIGPDYPQLSDIVGFAHHLGLQTKSPSLQVHVSSSDFVDEHYQSLGFPDGVESIGNMESQFTSPSLVMNITQPGSMVADESRCSVPAGHVGNGGSMETQPEASLHAFAMSTGPEYRAEVEAWRQVHVPEQPQPRGPGAQGDQFRFAPPKLFVGNRSNTQSQHRPTPNIGGKRGRGRWAKQRATDGRADIRALPNYTSDPIEDFEEPEQTWQSFFPL